MPTGFSHRNKTPAISSKPRPLRYRRYHLRNRGNSKETVANRDNIAASHTAYEQKLYEWSVAYRNLETQHKETSTDLTNMSQIFLCISQELDNAKRTILTYESTLKESERELQKDANQGQGVNQEGWKAQQMKREYQSALRDANDQLNATEQKLDNLWKEKVDLVREHQEALAATEDRAVIAEEKVAELEEKGT